MQVCPAGHYTDGPDVCHLCGMSLHTSPRADETPDTAPGSRTRALPAQDASSAPTVAMPAGPADDDPSQAATTAIPVSPDQGAVTTAIPSEQVRGSQAATTVLPDEPPGRATIAMPAGNPAATSVLPVAPPPPEPESARAPTEVFAPRPDPSAPGPPAPGPTSRTPASHRPEPPVPPTGATALLGPGRTRTWHAVLSVDAAWYAVQDTPYRMPSEGGNTVVPLQDGATLGRASRSRGTTPDIDCSADPGVSRRHAQFDLVDGRWYVQDLGSANGTYIAPAGAPLPEHPIAPGRRVEVGPGDTVYVGAWTRISIEDEDAWHSA